jgi:hypothetical protein
MASHAQSHVPPLAPPEPSPLEDIGTRRSPLSLREREPVGSLGPACGARDFAPLAEKIDALADLFYTATFKQTVD